MLHYATYIGAGAARFFLSLNPDLPNLEKEQKYQENLLDITIKNYRVGKLLSSQYFDVNMNRVLELEESHEEE